MTIENMPLVFEPYGSKLYAKTPTGELAFGDSRGLYEWRNGERIDYTGGDRQASDRKGRFTHGGSPVPVERGFAEALRGYRGPTN